MEPNPSGPPRPPLTHDDLKQKLADVLSDDWSTLRRIAAANGPDGDPANSPTDIVQSAVADVLRKEGKKPSPEVVNPKGLMRRVVRNKAIDRRRRHRSRRKRLGKAVSLDAASAACSGMQDAADRESSAAEPQEQLLQKELEAEMRALEQEQRERMATWLRELSRDQREAIVLHCNRLSVAEIAEYMERSPKAVRDLLDRGRAALRQRANASPGRAAGA
jgi:RNA polymerase sigma factor (sigma-70 family)